MPVRRPVRRTQADRREGTIRKLLDAATGSLIEVGYSETSVQEICARAGVSHGGLFRHFPSREALMVAVGADLGQQLLAGYRRQLETLTDRKEPLRMALELLRKTCRSPLNQALYELAMASRTNPRLRKAIAPMTAAYHKDILRLARQLLPELAAALGDRFEVLLDTVLAIFDGEQLHRFLIKKPAIEEARLDLLLGLVRSFGG